MSGTIADYKLSIKEVIYIVGVASAFIANNYSLKTEIRDAVMAANSEKRVVDLRLASLEKRDESHEKAIQIIGEMIEVSSPRLTRSKRN